MKTEAPDKIYLADFTDTTEPVFYAKRDNTHDTDIEYTRTDVLINKLEEWVKKTFSETDKRFKQDYTGMLLSNFRFYIKGE